MMKVKNNIFESPRGNDVMNENTRADNSSSFIHQARRNQIIDATIETLDEIGYVKASLAQIAKRANISTALISYHFANKHDLMDGLLATLVEKSTTYILNQVDKENAPLKKLDMFIQASLEYQYKHPQQYTALVEIVFHSRTADNTPYYKLNDDEEDPLLNVLQQILRSGQAEGIFGDCHLEVLSNTIQGAIGEYMFNSSLTKKVPIDMYSAELIRIVHRVLLI